jgi:hypothetical protein
MPGSPEGEQPSSPTPEHNPSTPQIGENFRGFAAQRPEPSKEDKIGRFGRPRGEHRIFRPIKLYKTAWDVWHEQENPDEGVFHIEVHESPDLPERTNAAIREWNEEARLREKTLSKVTPEERDRLRLEESILDLKTSGISQTVSGKIWELENGWIGLPAETLAKMQQLDPEFMNPIINAMNKRPARLAKAQDKIQRILQKRGEK